MFMFHCLSMFVPVPRTVVVIYSRFMFMWSVTDIVSWKDNVSRCRSIPSGTVSGKLIYRLISACSIWQKSASMGYILPDRLYWTVTR